MKRLLPVLVLFASSGWAVEVGLRIGWATISGKGEDVDFDHIASLYANVDVVSSPVFEAGPQITLSYAKRTFYSTYCYGYATACDYDFTYTSFELNGYGKLKMGVVNIYGGGGTSLNKLAVDVKDDRTGDVLYTPASETYAGFQAFAGLQFVFGNIGFGGELKYKKINSDDFDTLRAASVFASISF